MRRAQLQPVTFDAVDSASPTALRTGIIFVAGDVRISKDGGAFANVTNLPAEIGSTGVYGFNLTAAETNCSWIHVLVIKAGSMYPKSFGGAMSDQPAAAVVTGTSATSFVTNLTSIVDDFWKDSLVVFTSGALAGQVKKVTGYNGTTKALTFTAGFAAAPANGDLFILVNA